MTFHAWLSTDGEEDHCYQCGTITPVLMDGVVADYSPLPITCPGPLADGVPHHFTLGLDCIECAVCGYRINDTTLPADVNWVCRQESVPTPTPNVGTFACNGLALVAGVVSGCGSSFGHYAQKHAVAEALSFGWQDTMAAGAVVGPLRPLVGDGGRRGAVAQRQHHGWHLALGRWRLPCR
jgi:hypothetical protein